MILCINKKSSLWTHKTGAQKFKMLLKSMDNFFFLVFCFFITNLEPTKYATTKIDLKNIIYEL